jgi:uncharacterized protein (TIRG00374 family)
MWKRLLIGLLLAAAIIVFLALRMDGAAVAAALRAADTALLLSTFLPTLLSIWLKGRRWALAIAAGRGEPPNQHLFAATLIGIAGNLLLPARLGDFARVLVLRRHNQVPATRSLLASWSAQLFDLLAVAAILAGAGALGHALAPMPALLAVLGGVLLLLVLLWVAHRWPRLAERVEAALPAALRRRLGDTLVNARQGLTFLGSPRTVAAVLLYTAAVWCCDTAGMCLALRAFGIHVSPAVAAVLVAAIGLSFVLPLTPGNMGTYQVICVFVLGTWGVAHDQAFALGLGYQAFSLVSTVLLGWVFLQREGLDVSSLTRSAGAPATIDDAK